MEKRQRDVESFGLSVNLANMKAFFLSFLLLLSFGGCAGQQIILPKKMAHGGATIREVRIAAERYSFAPRSILVSTGEIIRMTVTSKELTRGIKIKPLGIDRVLPVGVPITFEFYASRPGTVKFRCSQFCGITRFWMSGRIIVK